MANSQEPVEYYVACNPPLLPKGVASMIAYAQEEFQGKIFEILYEPEIPWFKIIARTEYQTEVTAWFGERLECIFELETCLIDDSDAEFDYSDDDADTQVDLVVGVEEPQVIPWALYGKDSATHPNQYDANRYPAYISDLPYKCIWRGVETIQGLTISTLLEKFTFFWPTQGEQQIDALGEYTKCLIANNMASNMVYLASNNSPECLQLTVRRLENLLEFYNAPSSGISHLIFAEGARAFQFSYRYLSHIGLFNQTYVPMHIEDQSQEYQRLLHAATIRVNIQDSRGRWHEDLKTYPPEVAPNEKAWKPFSGLASCRYSKKEPNAIPPAKLQDLTTNPKKIISTLPDNDMGAKPTASPIVDLEGGLQIQLVGSHLADPSSPLKATTHVTEEATGVEQTLVEGDGSPRLYMHCPKIELRGSPASRRRVADVVNSWMAAIQEPLAEQPETKTESPDLLKDFGFDPLPSGTPKLRASGALIDFSDDSPTKTMIGSPILSASGKMPGNALPDDLMDVPQPHLNMPALMDTLNPEQNPEQNPQPTQKPSDDLAIFGKRDDPEAQNFSTMKQRAGKKNRPKQVRPKDQPPSPKRVNFSTRDSWATVASTSKSTSQLTKEDLSFGPNVKVTSKLEGEGQAQKKGGSRSQDFSATQLQSSLKMNETEGQDLFMEPAHGAGEPSMVIRNHTPISSSTPTYQVVPGLERPITPSPGPGKVPGMSAVLQEAVGKTKDLLQIAQIVPGEIQLETKFGRAAIKGCQESTISTGTGPSWPVDLVLSTLNEEVVDAQWLGFHTILTTNGEELELLPRATGLRGGSWKHREALVYYDVFCKGQGQQGQNYNIEVDAKTFSYRCLNPQQQLSSLVVHCAHRAWDIQVCLGHRILGNIPDAFVRFAQGLMVSLGVSTTPDGHVDIRTPLPANSAFRIRGVEIRHVVTYVNELNGSCLKITMTRSVKRHPDSYNNPTFYRGSTCATTKPGTSDPTQWYEASITSTRANTLFEQNENLELGEIASWTADEFRSRGIISEMIDPALRMVQQMDSIGRTNLNGKGPRAGQKRFDPVAAEEERNKDYFYW